jgi:glycosyltransferase involved in cell wall biosynthesis
MEIKFSILVPTIPSRTKFLMPLVEKLQAQIKDHPVEIVAVLDNKKRSIGLKRDALVQIALGDYLAFVDDDDEVADDYVDSILKMIEDKPGVDVITFKQWVTINGGNPFTVDFRVGFENEQAHQIDDIWQNIQRSPFHVCVWRRKLCQKFSFADASYGEDWHWAKRVLEEVQSASHIDKHLHFYRYSDAITEAALDFVKD